MQAEELKQYYRGKRVLVTGHTGFKGSWLCAVLALCGAEVYGYSLKPETEDSLFEILYGKGAGERTRENLSIRLPEGFNELEGEAPAALSCSHIGDIRNFEELFSFYQKASPDLVLHLAAQPIVRDSYRIPRETYETNVMGTVNLMECLRLLPGCRAFLNVTTDKVYLNEERPGYGYREADQLDGFDPYSNSKSCSELVTHSYFHSFFEGREGAPAISTARAGNVIGGGDFAHDRIVPDCVRAARKGEEILLRNPNSTRPYQHVLEPIMMYLRIAAETAERTALSGWYNVGPDDCDCVTTGELADRFVKAYGEGLRWRCPGNVSGPHEANFLKLDNGKIKAVFGWKPVWHIDQAVLATVAWSKAWRLGETEANAELLREVRAYFADSRKAFG